MAGTAGVRRIARSSFPGNVRGLGNVAAQLAIYSRGQTVARIERDTEGLLPPSRSPEGTGEHAGTSMRSGRVTDEAIQEALRQHNYNFAAAATALGINRSTLYQRTRSNGIDVRSASTLTDDEILASHARHGGDISAIARELRVSPKPLKVRLNGLLRRQPG